MATLDSEDELYLDTIAIQISPIERPQTIQICHRQRWSPQRIEMCPIERQPPDTIEMFPIERRSPQTIERPYAIKMCLIEKRPGSSGPCGDPTGRKSCHPAGGVMLWYTTRWQQTAVLVPDLSRYIQPIRACLRSPRLTTVLMLWSTKSDQLFLSRKRNQPACVAVVQRSVWLLEEAV